MADRPAFSEGVTEDAGLRATLGSREAIAICVGIVIGAGIFGAPSLVAANSASETAFLLSWVAGGILSIIGAFCYAELAAAYPGAGGDYSYLSRAFGGQVGFVYAWARLSIIQTGSLALLAFVFGDYLAQIIAIGPFGPTVFAVAAVVGLTAINWSGVRQGTRTQVWLTASEVGGLVVLIIVGILIAPAADPAPVAAAGSTESGGQFGLALVFVLLTFGGWSETAYTTAELKEAPRRIAKVLVGSLTIVVALYLLVNVAYLQVLGLDGIRQSEAVATDVMRAALGQPGAYAISLIVAIAALTSANATIFTGARSAYALGGNVPALRWLGRWNAQRGTPGNALAAQGAVALLLVLIGGLSRDGFRSAVEYTAPVFWLFMLGVGVALFILRAKDSGVARPFRVPFYPVLPLIFCATSAYLLYSSIAYSGFSALLGVAVLAIGVVLSLLLRFDPIPSPQKELAQCE